MNYFNNTCNHNDNSHEENKQKFCFCKMAKQTCYYPTECFYCYKKEEKKDDCYDKFEDLNCQEWKNDDCEEKQTCRKDNNRNEDKCCFDWDNKENTKDNCGCKGCNQKNVERKCECHHRCCFRSRWF